MSTSTGPSSGWCAVPTEGSLHWLKVDGVGMGIWSVERGEDGDIVLRPRPLNQITTEELFQTGIIEWRSK